MRQLDLFSGIGGFALAASWVWGSEHEIHSFVEIEPFCQKILNKHWPNVPIHDDIRTYKHDGTAIDLLTGGFPCQPFSVAGKRRGKEDNRALWPAMLEVIQASRPAWIIGENVAGIVNMELENYISDLEGEGYEVQAFIIPACAQNAPHRRDRVWIVGYSNNPRIRIKMRINENGKKETKKRIRKSGFKFSSSSKDATYSSRLQCNTGRFEQPLQRIRPQSQTFMANPFSSIKRRHGIRWPSRISWWEREPQEVICDAWQGRRQEDGLPGLEPQLGRVAYGIPDRVDRLKSLGNAIVPQVVVPIMEAIKQIDNTVC